MMDADLDFEEMKLYEELYNLMGAKIRFRCDGYIQEGIIKTVLPKSKRVTLNNVYFVLPDKRIFSGTLKYRFPDLVNYEVVATAKELNPYPRFEYLENLFKDNNNISKKYSINDVFFDGNLSDSEDEEGGIEDVEEEEFQFEVPKHLENKVPFDSVIVDCFDLEWKQAIKHIGNQKTIGVSFHGTKVSRLGKLSWLCVSTSWCVFLFDIEKLGVDAFNNGLKRIFEDSRIIKIIHDSRFPSDCLAHKFDTKLVNVFDTLVADFVVSMQCYNDKHKYEYVQSLNSSLRIYLDIPPEFSYARDRCKQKIDENDFYSKRPLKNDFKYVLIKDTIYLQLLHEVLAKKLLGPLHRNVDRYLKVIAGASKQALAIAGDEISSPDCIPSSLLMHGIQTVQFHKVERKEPPSLKCKFLDPITGKEIDVKKHSVGEVKSSMACCTEKTLNSPKPNKEICSNTVLKDKQQKLHVIKSNENYDTGSVQLNKKSITSTMIVRPSSRHMDEVYHKLVNSSHFHSKNADSLVNVKPPKNCVSKFTMRLPLECVAFNNRESNNSVIADKTIFQNPSESSSIIVPDTSSNLSDYEDTWAKLRSTFSDSCNVSKNSKIKFVPAGMC